MHSRDTGPTVRGDQGTEAQTGEQRREERNDIVPVNQPGAPTPEPICRIGRGGHHGSFTRASRTANSRDTGGSETSPHVTRRPHRRPGPDRRPGRGGDALGRAAAARRAAAPSRRPARRPPREPGGGRAGRPAGRGRPGHAGHGCHVHRLLRRPGHRPGVAVRRHPPGDRRHRVASHRGGPRPAPPGPQPVHRRPVQRPAGDRRRRVPGRAAGDASNFRPECVGVRPAYGVWAHISGSDLVRDDDGRVYVLEDNLQVPVGRQLPAREPPRVQAGVRRPVRPPEHPTGRRLPRPALHAARLARPRRGGRPDGRRAHPRRLQLGLLRARLPRPPDGVPLVEGRDLFVRADVVRLHAHGRAGPSRSTSSTAGSTTCSSTPTSCTPTRPSACRAVAPGVAGRERGHRQRAGRRRRRRQGRVRVGARPHPLLPRRRADPAQRPDVPVPLRRGAPVRARPHARAGHQAGQRERRLRDPDRRPRHRRGPGRRARAIQADPRAGWPSRSWRCRPRPPSSTRASRPATSTCGRSSSPGAPATSPGAADPGGAAKGLAGGQLVAGRRQQGHVGGRVRDPPPTGRPQPA